MSELKTTPKILKYTMKTSFKGYRLDEATGVVYSSRYELFTYCFGSNYRGGSRKTLLTE